MGQETTAGRSETEVSMAAGRARPATESAPRDCRCPAKESAADRTKSASVRPKIPPLSDLRVLLCPTKETSVRTNKSSAEAGVRVSRSGCQTGHITCGCQNVHITIQCRGDVRVYTLGSGCQSPVQGSVSGCTPHSKHRFPAPSSKLCQI